MESLVGGQLHTIPTDKIIHFSGYFILSMIFILSLRPKWFIPVLLGLTIMGILIEYLQPFNARAFDTGDMYADTLGVAVGGASGLLVRWGYAFIRKELASTGVKRRLRHFAPGRIILREGDPVEHFFIIKSGIVQLSRKVKGQSTNIAGLGPGEAIGILGVIQGHPQYTTVKAIDRTVLYRMKLAQLMDSAGGRELPVSIMLSALTEKLQMATEKLAEAEIELVS